MQVAEYSRITAIILCTLKTEVLRSGRRIFFSRVNFMC